MRIQVDWDNAERTVIRYDFGQDWSWEDYLQAREALLRLAAEIDHAFDLIANFENSTPPSPGAIVNFKAGWNHVPANLQRIVVNGGGAFVRALAITFMRLYPHLGSRMLLTDSLAQARDLLREPHSAAM